MRHPAETYARAFFEVYEKNGDADIERLRSVLKKNGDIASMRNVCEAIERMIITKRGGRMVGIECARSMPAFMSEKVKKIFSANDRVKMIANPSLVAGMRITINSERELDVSLQRKLRRMFFAI